jgi:putative peptide zinc metalloprotease protein
MTGRFSRLRRPLTALVLAVGLTASTAGIAAADSVAVAINTKDGSSIFRFAFHITRVMGDVVDQSNAAAAVSSCTDCQTVAVAIQVVLIMSDASVITPTNEAIALNIECSGCETLASAFQYVLSTGGPVHFTAEGNQEIAQLRHQLIELMKNSSTMSLTEIQAQVEQIAHQLAHVVATQLVPAGRSGAGGGGSTTGPSPSEGPSPSSSASETPSPTESPTGSGTAVASPSSG